MKKYLALLCTFTVCFLLLCGCSATAQSVPAAPASSTSAVSAGSAVQDTDVSAGPWAQAVVYWYDWESTTSIPFVLYAAPSTDGEILVQSDTRLPSNFYCLAQQDGWLYGNWGNWLGWVKADSLVTDDTDTSAFIPLPSFMTAEQQAQFLRATEIFNAYLCHNFGLLQDYTNVQEVPYPGHDFNLTYAKDNAWASYTEFDKALHSLFTQEFITAQTQQSIDEGCPMFMEIDGGVYMIQADRGIWGCDVEGYTLTEQTDTRLAFDVNFIFKTELAEHRCSLPVVLVKTADGWRFDSFTSRSDDMRWMPAMGEDFDPYEGKE